MKGFFDYAFPLSCLAFVALVMFGSWGTVIIVLVVLILLMGAAICFLFEGAMGVTKQAERAAQLEPQLAELEKQLVVANNTIKQNARDYELNARTWQQQLDKYAAELAEKNKRIETLQKGAPKIPKGDDDAIKKLFR